MSVLFRCLYISTILFMECSISEKKISCNAVCNNGLWCISDILFSILVNAHNIQLKQKTDQALDYLLGHLWFHVKQCVRSIILYWNRSVTALCCLRRQWLRRKLTGGGGARTVPRLRVACLQSTVLRGRSCSRVEHSSFAIRSRSRTHWRVVEWRPRSWPPSREF